MTLITSIVLTTDYRTEPGNANPIQKNGEIMYIPCIGNKVYLAWSIATHLS